MQKNRTVKYHSAVLVVLRMLVQRSHSQPASANCTTRMTGMQ